MVAMTRPTKKKPAVSGEVSLANGDIMLPTAQAAVVAGVKPATMRDWRHEDIGPPWLKIGESKQARVLYPRSGLEQWLRSRIGGGAAE